MRNAMSLELKTRIITSIFLIIGFFLMLINNYFLIMSLLLIFVFTFLEFSSMTNKIFFTKKFTQLIYNCLFITYTFFFLIIFYLLLLQQGTRIFVIFFLLLCISSDIGGLVIGKIFKGRKLTKISPNKTISGSLGSFLFSLLTATSVVFYFDVLDWLKLMVIALFVSTGCQLGDIYFSYLKRKAKIKDTGNILPGHGGLLDRFDGILFGIPFGIIGATFSYFIFS